MDKISLRGKIIGIIAIAAVLALIILIVGWEEKDFSDKYIGFDLTGASSGRTNIYSRYMERHANVPAARYDIPIDIFNYSSAEGVSVIENHVSRLENNFITPRVLLTEERSFVEYTVNIQTAGMYAVQMEYFPVQARGIPIERSFFVNGEVPFLGADRLSFPRVWGDAGAVGRDNQDNDIRPRQIEIPRWETIWFKDSLGYIVEPYTFYLHEGENTLRLVGMNEPLAIRSLTLRAPQKTPTYREYLAGINLNRFANTRRNYSLKIQGEHANRRSDSSLYGIYDRSSGATDPASVARIRLNMIGGEPWRIAGQWIEWDFDVPEDGMYRITIKGRQNYNRGFVSNRSIMINGQIICEELAAVPFAYTNKWRHYTLSDTQGDIFIPLERGSNSLRMQVTLGEMGDMLNTMEESVFRLNTIYRKILVLTGPEPDVFRDYRVEHVYPEVIEAMALESKILYKLVDDLTRYSGERSAEAAVALTIARQLEYFVRRPDKIPSTLINFKGNISSLGDSLLSLSLARLDVDYILITAEDAVIQPINENFFVTTWHEIKSFFASFVVDYNSLGNKFGRGDPNLRGVIEVWVLSGRDQSTILKAMIDENFTQLSRIGVNLKLVAPDAVMPAIVAGTGPDMVLTVPHVEIINYAIRGAVVDISKFPDFNQVISELNESVIIPFMFQGGVYGLPETQYYHVMYYRKDIMEELEIELPDTWDDLINIMPIIQKNNMNVGVPSVANPVAPDFSNFLAHLFQRGGRLYNEEGSRTLLDTEVAIDAFDFYTKFFTHYKTPVMFDFTNRFRTGEMPLAFNDYSWFNTLEIFAPELRGLWGFARMPGLRKEDGSVDRSIPTGALASMIFSSSKHPELAWEFLRWWVSADVQLRFGRELESLMGSAARYPTANYNAFRQLPWGSEQMAVLDEQRAWTVGTPEVPGGYFVSRHIINATRRILNEGQDTRETLLDYSITINDELIRKRKEFGLE
ncbi:MAG: extracellular solute-binding protein [Treponema sp.]|nr:extracellular solute-binding protein [Treponema sp.]